MLYTRLSGKKQEIAAKKKHDAQHIRAALEVVRENVSRARALAHSSHTHTWLHRYLF